MIKLVTDSTAYLSQEIAQKYGIKVVPLCVHFGKEAFKEGVEMSNEAFYTRLQEAAELPTTSQPSAGDFLQVFQGLADHDIVTLTISQRLSGTWSSAMAAARMLPEAKITVIDTRSTSAGLQMMVEAAAQAIEAGATAEQVVALVEEIKAKMYLLFVVDTLEYLAKGGRIGNAKAFLGTLLKVKPILVLEDGAIEPLEQVRSKRKAVSRMLDLIEERVDGQAPQAKISIAQALVPAEAEAVAQEIVDRLGCARPVISELGPVIGTHTGPGVIGVACYT